MKNNPFQIAVTVAKVAGSVAALSSYFNQIPAKYLPIGVLVVGVASAIKEIAVAVENFYAPPTSSLPSVTTSQSGNGFTPPVSLIALTLAIFSLTACATFQTDATNLLKDGLEGGQVVLADVETVANGLYTVTEELTPAQLSTYLLAFGGPTPSASFKAVVASVVLGYQITGDVSKDVYSLAGALDSLAKSYSSKLAFQERLIESSCDALWVFVYASDMSHLMEMKDDQFCQR
jgi:hypothetical protein